MHTTSSGSKEKMNVLDLIIETLQEHEKHLDRLTERLQSLIEALSTKVEKEKPTKPSAPLGKIRPEPPQIGFSLPAVECARWNDFKERSKEAKVVTFEIDDRGLIVSYAHAGVVYKYIIEITPSSEKLRRWLSENLSVPEEKIVEGRIT